MNRLAEYKNFINNILNTRGRFAISDNRYKERHHILPRSLGGKDIEENLIDLYADEHFIAHKLLYEAYPDNYSLVKAYSMMAFVVDSNQKRYRLTAEEYREVREALHKVPVPEKTKLKISEANTGKTAWNKGLTKETDERVALHSKNLSESLIKNGTRKGENNSQFGNKGRISGSKNPMHKAAAKEKIGKHMKHNNPMKDPAVAEKAHSKLRGRPTHNSVKVKCVETGETFNSIRELISCKQLYSGVYQAIRKGEAYRGYHYIKLEVEDE